MTFADDAGEYTIFARNPLGEISASAMLLDEGWFSGDYIINCNSISDQLFIVFFGILQRHMSCM